MSAVVSTVKFSLAELESQKRALALDEAYVAVCDEFGIPPMQLWLRRRTRWIVRQRRMVATRMRNLGYSLPEIGRAMRRHHTSILSLLRGGKGKSGTQ